MRSNSTLLLAVTLPCALALGCGGHSSGARRGSTTAPAASGQAPQVTVLSLNTQPASPAPVVSASPVDVAYRLRDADSDVAAVAVDYTLDGVTWSPATRFANRGDLTTGLGTTPTGTTYIFSWDALADLGPAVAQVRLRLTPSDAAAGAPATADLIVAVGLTGPGVSVVATPGPGSTPPTPPTPPTTPTTPSTPTNPTSPTNPTTPSAAFVNRILPTLGARGRTVRIQGAGFAPSLTDNVVRFGGVAGQVVLARTDELVVATPTNVPLGPSPVTVTVRGVPATPSFSFRFLADPQILSVTPASAAVGDLITIVGSEFDTLSNGVSVRFSGGVSVLGTARGAGMIQVTVPAGAQSGSIYLVTHGATSNALPFTVVAPTPPTPPTTPTTSSVPVVTQAGTPAGTAQDAVSIPYAVRDADGDRTRVEVEYQLGFAPWSAATPHTTSDPIHDVLAPVGGATYTFVWDSTADVGVTSGPLTARLRIRASDASGSSAWRATNAFVLSNTASPSLPSGGGNAAPDILSVGTPSSPQSAVITIPYTVADRESDHVQIEVRYMLSAITGWQTCTLHATSDPITNVTTSAAGRSYRFVWDARADLGFVLTSAVIVQVRARDAVLGPGRTTGSFRVDAR